MQIDIEARGFALSAGLRTHVEHRLKFVLSRFRDRLMRVAVRLSDINGSKGGVDKRCQLQLRLRGLPDIIVKDTEADLFVAVDRAADRAGRTLGRHLRRARGDFDHGTVWRDE